MRGLLCLILVASLSSMAYSQEVIKGTGGLRSSEQLSQNGVSTIAFENIPWLPNLTDVEFSRGCRFKITQSALVYDQDAWFTSDPSFTWSSISKIVVWQDRLFFGPWIGIYGNDGGQLMAKSCDCNRDSANQMLAALSHEVSRGHSEIVVDSQAYWSFPSLTIVALVSGVIIASIGGAWVSSATDGATPPDSEEVVGLATLAAFLIAITVWLLGLSPMTCACLTALFIPITAGVAINSMKARRTTVV